LEEDNNDLEILEFRLIVQNEQQANKLNASISIVEENGSHRLKIDSSNFCSNNLLEKSELEVITYIEIKYTNKIGVEKNQCNIFKMQLNIQFTQTLYFSLQELNDLEANKFEMILHIKNLSESSILLEQSKKQIEIKENQNFEFKIEMKKLEFELNLDETNIIERINNNLQLKYSLKDSKSSSVLKFNSQTQNFKNYLSNIFLCPIDLSIQKMAFPSDLGPCFFSLMLIAKNNMKNIRPSSNYCFHLNWKTKLKYSIVSKNYDWILNVIFFITFDIRFVFLIIIFYSKYF
jgi:hypothetical protein